MKLVDYIDKKHDGNNSEFAREYTAELIKEGVLTPPKHIHRQQVDVWVANGALWSKRRIHPETAVTRGNE